MKRKRHHLLEKVANDLRKEVRAQSKGGSSAKPMMNSKKNEKMPAGREAF